MIVSIDQLGREIILKNFPKRIISIVPSQTEFLFDLGLNEQVVGITKFCVHPKEMFIQKPRIGGTKTLDFKKIDDLHPDLIIGNKEENQKEQIEILMQKYPVWMSDIKNLSEATAMMLKLGELVDKKEEATSIVNKILKKFKNLKSKDSILKGNKVAYFIWRKPYMSIGKDTFINEMLKTFGLENVFSEYSRYPQIDDEILRETKTDFIFLSSEPYPFKEKHYPEFKALCPQAKIILVDGEMFSWYGSRLLEAPDYFKGLMIQLKNAY